MSGSTSANTTQYEYNRLVRMIVAVLVDNNGTKDSKKTCRSVFEMTKYNGV